MSPKEIEVITPKRILVIVKKRTMPFYDQSGNAVSSGLKNSAGFVVELLNGVGYIAQLAEVDDNNCIDRVITEFNPNVVIIEALWVVPSKFEVLKKLHPDIKWVVRLHSDIPFIAHEGIAIEWIYDCIQEHVIIATNSERIAQEIVDVFRVHNSVVVLPNYYPLSGIIPRHKLSSDGFIDVGCFGAIRPMKNHLLQAMAAIQFANIHKKILRFHINDGRVEDKGEPILKNLRSLFEHIEHELIEHPWYPHNDFLNLVATMDISMQCSFSETFNIVTADAVSRNIPIVVSHEIRWVDPLCQADPNSSIDMIKALTMVWNGAKGNEHTTNYKRLMKHNEDVKNQWGYVIGGL